MSAPHAQRVGTEVIDHPIVVPSEARARLYYVLHGRPREWPVDWHPAVNGAEQGVDVGAAPLEPVPDERRRAGRRERNPAATRLIGLGAPQYHFQCAVIEPRDVLAAECGNFRAAREEVVAK